MAEAAYNVLVGFEIGQAMQAKSANKKMAKGLLDYRQLLEKSSAGVLDTATSTDKDKLQAQLDQAEQTFFTGLKASNLDVASAAEAMKAFNSVKSGYVLPNMADAIGGWGTPAGTDAFRRAYGALRPGETDDIKINEDGTISIDTGGKDEDGNPILRPITVEDVQGMYAAATDDPNVLMTVDKNQREADAAIVEAARAAEKHEFGQEQTTAEIAATEALTRQRDATTAYNLARTEDTATGDADASKMVQSTSLVDDLMDYPDLDDFRIENGGTFDAVFMDFYKALKEQDGTEPTRRQVLDAMQANLPAEG